MTDISKIYTKEAPIYVSDLFFEQLDCRRKEKYEADKSLLEGSAKDIDIENIENLPNGKIKIEVGGARFECFFHRGKNEKLYIILDGARTHSGGLKREIPIYNRWSWYSFAGCSWLSIEDPMYYDNDNLLLGWFYGDEKRNYREFVAIIADRIVKYLKIDHKNVVFYGGSGGGTAAIHSAALYGECTAVSINGQINFEYQHKDIIEFKKQTGIDLHQIDKFNRNDLCKIMAEALDTKFILIENCRSKWDFRDHLGYLSKKLQITPEYGISKFNNIYIWIYDAMGKSPHTSFEDKNLFFAVNFLTEIARDNEEVQQYKSLFLLFNEIWHDLYTKTKNKEIKECNVEVVNSDIIDRKKFSLFKVITDISIIASEDKYNNYCLKEIKNNTAYVIDIMGTSSSAKINKFTVGLYDFSDKKFLFRRELKLNKDESICFTIGTIKNRIGLCLFSGEHGFTQNKDLKIEKLNIYTMSV